MYKLIPYNVYKGNETNRNENYKYLTTLCNSNLPLSNGLFLCMYNASERLRFRVLRCIYNITTLMLT